MRFVRYLLTQACLQLDLCLRDGQCEELGYIVAGGVEAQPPNAALALQGSRAALMQRPGTTIEVTLPPIQASQEDPGPCLIRTEPGRDSVCTFEAVIRCLAALIGVPVRYITADMLRNLCFCRALSLLENWSVLQTQAYLEPMRLMCRMQKQFNPSIAQREAAYAAASCDLRGT